MNLTDIAMMRLTSQQIAATEFKTVKELVRWMGAMQAQDYAMVKWAIGARLPHLTDPLIETAINQGEIIRTHLLRPTWHLVSADDIYWLLELTAPKIKASSQSRYRDLGLTEAVLTKSNNVLEKALRGGQHLTHEALMVELQAAGIATNDNRSAHLLMWAELNGLVCSGATQAGKQTYTLLAERVPQIKSLTKEEALAKLSKRYFTSHAPATLQDFIWWSGLSVGEAKRALDMVKSEFIAETVAAQTYWLPQSFAMPTADVETAYLLPAFDEFIISYKDRRASLPFANHHKTVSNNGIFRPIIVVNGQVIGIWKRAIKKDKVLVETEFFQQPQKSTQTLIEKAAIQYGQFLGKSVEIKHKE